MKMMNRISCILLVLVMVLAMSVNVFATDVDGSVTYEGKAKEFIFAPGSQYSPTDLFTNFKGVMPGDVLTEEITVSNSNKKQVRIYMQCKYDSYVDTDAKDFLDQLKLTVEASDKTIFEAAADEKAQLSKPVLLGTFKQKGEVELKVTLKVPIELGNEYMNQIGVVPWTFLIEEIPEDGTPDTGDWFQTGMWVGIAAVIVAAIFLLLIVQKKRRTENE